MPSIPEVMAGRASVNIDRIFWAFRKTPQGILGVEEYSGWFTALLWQSMFRLPVRGFWGCGVKVACAQN